MNANANDISRFGDLTNLSAGKLQQLETILTPILASPVARETFAQIIDGMPIRTPYSDGIKASRSHLRKTVIVSHNTKPSDLALQQYDKIRTAFSAPQQLRIDSKVAQNYQNAPPGSREHRFRLLEIVAASVNALAGIVYASYHRGTDIRPQEPREGYVHPFHGTDEFYVNFYHTNYQQFGDFPFGLLNVVGYWAEAELFGGVILFEREESDSEIINAFLHQQTAAHAFQLSEKQLKSFASLGTTDDAAKSTGAEAVLPFTKEPNARTESTFVRMGDTPLHIYKNDYDKQPVSYVPKDSHCVIMQGDENDPRAAAWEETMKEAQKIIQERGQNQGHRPGPGSGISPSEPSV